MKQIFTIFAAVLLTVTGWAQSPEKMSYQAVVRDANDDLVKNGSISLKISILQSDTNGAAVYEETQGSMTNTNGLVSIEIGDGSVVSGDFSAIDWSAGPYFIKIEIDIEQDGIFDITSTSQLLSTPYALYAKTADGINGGISYEEINDAPIASQIDSSYIVEMAKSDKDFVNFGTFTNFTNSSSWAVIERVKMPVGTGADGGWHFFRGYAWGDKDGDIAIQISSTQVYAWVRQGGWQDVSYSHSFDEDQWYDICLQYDASTQIMELYVDGTPVGQHTGIAPQDDSGNTNKMFWGGQDYNGSLYAEASIVIANQVWLQRVLTPEEIQNYDGQMDSDPATFFSSQINSSSVTDATGNGHDGVNGITPEYIVQTQQSSEFNHPVHINDNVVLSKNIQITGDINNHSSSGMTVVAPVGTNATGFGAALYVSSDGALKEADANTVASMPCVALALESGTGDKEILLQGFIKNEDWTWTPGGLIYVSTTTGAVSQTKPSASGQQVQILGVAVSDDMIYFTPNLMLIEIQ